MAKEKAIKICWAKFQFVFIFIPDRLDKSFKYCNKLYFQTNQESKLQSNQNSPGLRSRVQSYESLFFSLSACQAKDAVRLRGVGVVQSGVSTWTVTHTGRWGESRLGWLIRLTESWYWHRSTLTRLEITPASNKSILMWEMSVSPLRSLKYFSN